MAAGCPVLRILRPWQGQGMGAMVSDLCKEHGKGAVDSRAMYMLGDACSQLNSSFLSPFKYSRSQSLVSLALIPFSPSLLFLRSSGLLVSHLAVLLGSLPLGSLRSNPCCPQTIFLSTLPHCSNFPLALHHSQDKI